MPEVHPAIAKKIEELLLEAQKLIDTHAQNLSILAKTVEIKDIHGLKMRLQETIEFADRIQWIVAQLDALRALPYDMAAESITATRRRSSTSTMAAVTVPVVPDKKDGGT